MKSECNVETCKTDSLARGFCKKHYRRWQEYGDPLGGHWFNEVENGIDRKCNTCGEIKLLSEFPKSDRNAHGRARKCTKCTNEYARNWSKTNPKQRAKVQRLANVRRKYGDAGLAIHARITAGEGCEICGKVRSRMAIDHCHATGVVRGLLCSNCNTALGLVGEKLETLYALIKYLEKHNVS